nr:MAG TPA: hypothetical protein [Caudoviricetes sp.]
MPVFPTAYLIGQIFTTFWPSLALSPFPKTKVADRIN